MAELCAFKARCMASGCEFDFSPRPAPPLPYCRNGVITWWWRSGPRFSTRMTTGWQTGQRSTSTRQTRRTATPTTTTGPSAAWQVDTGGGSARGLSLSACCFTPTDCDFYQHSVLSGSELCASHVRHGRIFLLSCLWNGSLSSS